MVATEVATARIELRKSGARRARSLEVNEEAMKNDVLPQDLGISIVIPTWNSSAQIGRLLNSVRSQTQRVLEVVVVDNNSNDGTAAICGQFGARFYALQAGRSEARNFGAAQSSGEFVLFLDSDMELTPHVAEKCSYSIKDEDALCVKERVIAGRNYWARARAIERDAFFGTKYFESPRFFRKDVFIKAGGYDAGMVGFEDLDLHARLIEGGLRVGWVDATILHHEESVGFAGYLRKRKLYSTTAATYALRHPAFWKEVVSFRRRVLLLLRVLRRSGAGDILLLFPGLILMRALELFMAGRSTG